MGLLTCRKLFGLLDGGEGCLVRDADQAEGVKVTSWAWVDLIDNCVFSPSWVQLCCLDS